MGGFAEFVRVPERHLGLLPTGLSYEQAACLPQAAAIAWQGLHERANVQSGQSVLINGAGGGAGMYGIQLAKLAGAQVTGVDNGEKLEFMRSLGADHVLDYAAIDFTRQGREYDLVLDLVGQRGPRDYRRALARGGCLLYVGGSTSSLLRVALSRGGAKRLRVLVVRPGVHQLAQFIELCRSGTITTYVDRRFTLDGVPEALRYLGEGHAKGKVVITMP
jgi:NADPH:quinone reductase-like Zn-dependent oxidoreductase